MIYNYLHFSDGESKAQKLSGFPKVVYSKWQRQVKMTGLTLAMYTLYPSLLHAKSLQSCPPLCNPMDCSPPGSSVHGILQARILEWAAIPSSRGSSQPRDLSHVSYCSCIAGNFLPLSHQGSLIWPYWHPVLALPVSRTARNKCLLFMSQPTCSVFLQHPNGQKELGCEIFTPRILEFIERL